MAAAGARSPLTRKLNHRLPEPGAPQRAPSGERRDCGAACPGLQRLGAGRHRPPAARGPAGRAATGDLPTGRTEEVASGAAQQDGRRLVSDEEAARGLAESRHVALGGRAEQR